MFIHVASAMTTESNVNCIKCNSEYLLFLFSKKYTCALRGVEDIYEQYKIIYKAKKIMKCKNISFAVKKNKYNKY